MTHLAEHFKQRRMEKGLRLADIAQMVGYTNISRGVRRIEAFERSGRVHPELLAKLVKAVDIDQATVNRLAYADYQNWFAAVSKPGTPYMVRRILFGGGVRRLPAKLKTTEAMEKYAANFARKCGTDVCLIVSLRIKVWFSKDGSLKEVVEKVPGE